MVYRYIFFKKQLSIQTVSQQSVGENKISGMRYYVACTIRAQPVYR